MVTRRREHGFSLIELLVGLSIACMLLLVGAPLAGGWIDSNNVRQTNHRLLEGMARAKALALNNTGLVSDSTPAAYLLTDGTTICVYGSTAPAALSCGNTAVWSAAVTATLKINAATTQCVALNNRALAVSATISGTACTTTLTYNIQRGTETFPTSGTNVLY